MGEYARLKAARPVRYRIAWVVYRALWWPIAAVAVPFVLIAGFVDWLSWTAIPATGRVFQPIWGFAHRRSLGIGHAILGYRPARAKEASDA